LVQRLHPHPVWLGQAVVGQVRAGSARIWFAPVLVAKASPVVGVSLGRFWHSIVVVNTTAILFGADRLISIASWLGRWARCAAYSLIHQEAIAQQILFGERHLLDRGLRFLRNGGLLGTGRPLDLLLVVATATSLGHAASCLQV
jgi:hypothetical protein